MVSLKCQEIFCLLYSATLFLSGIMLIGFAAVLSYKLFYHFKFVPADTLGPFALIFVLGFVHLYLTWLGVKGPTKEHDFHIILFTIITAALFFIEISTCIWGIVIRYKVGDKTVELMKESLTGYVRNDYDKKEWMLLESKLHCCGLDGDRDYTEKGTLPLSCCTRDQTGDLKGSATCGKLYDIGCRLPFIEYTKSLVLQLSIISLVSSLFQVCGVVTFYFFYKKLKEERLKRTTRRISRVNTSYNQQVLPVSPVPITTPSS